jgi:hypothetical protein
MLSHAAAVESSTGLEIQAAKARAWDVVRAGHAVPSATMARAAIPSMSSASALEKRSVGTARGPWSMWCPQTGAKRIDDHRELRGLHVQRTRDRMGPRGNHVLERTAHLRASLGEAPAKGAVARRMGKELHIQRPPLGIAGHRVERVLRRELRLAARGFGVIVDIRKDRAKVLGALCAPTIQQLQELSITVSFCKGVGGGRGLERLRRQ